MYGFTKYVLQSIIYIMDKYKLINLISNITVFLLFVITAFFVFTRDYINTFNNVYSVIFLVLNAIEFCFFLIIIFMFIMLEKGTRGYHALVKASISFFVYFILGVLIILSLAVR